MSRPRDIVVSSILRLLRLALPALSKLVPKQRSVVVAAFPESEGNAVEVARALLRRYDGTTVWLRPSGPVPPAVQALARDGLSLVASTSLRGLWAYLRAEAIMFTHGLYGSPPATSRAPVVNIWHGDGPKDVSPANGVGGMISSTYFVGSTRLFSEHQAAGFCVPPERVLLTGNPRTDQMFRPLPPEHLAALGINGDFVVWMPTFRHTRAVGAMRAQSEVGDDAPSDSQGLELLADQLRDRGLQLVIKPHPMDAALRSRPGALTISDSDLAASGVTLYGLLGVSRGLVTDYSSVWVDYLLLDRPMAFLVPDRDSYTRGLIPPDVLDWVPGEVVGAATPFQEFLADLDAGGRVGAPSRAEAAHRIGLARTRTSADDLLTALSARGVLAARPQAPQPD